MSHLPPSSITVEPALVGKRSYTLAGDYLWTYLSLTPDQREALRAVYGDAMLDPRMGLRFAVVPCQDGTLIPRIDLEKGY